MALETQPVSEVAWPGAGSPSTGRLPAAKVRASLRAGDKPKKCCAHSPCTTETWPRLSQDATEIPLVRVGDDVLVAGNPEPPLKEFRPLLDEIRAGLRAGWEGAMPTEADPPRGGPGRRSASSCRHACFENGLRVGLRPL
jgi:hypothetical protein